MVNQKMLQYGSVRSAIRDLSEYGNQRRAEIGRGNVFDYSLGNPSVPAPDKVADELKLLAETVDPVALHGYTSATGDINVRRKMIKDINLRYETDFTIDDIYLTCGAAASLAITLKALTEPGDEFVAIAPFFAEYKVFTEAAGAKFVVCEADTEHFMIDFDKLEEAVNENTKGIIINYPNNPTGVIPDKQCLESLVAFLEYVSKSYGHPVFLISDEPYRELNYEYKYLPYFTNLYDHTIVCYSFSKALSLPGERIGYVVVSNKFEGHKDVYAAICGAGRALGYVCAPSTMQRVVSQCINVSADLEVYKTNRDILYNSLKQMGYDCTYPDGAFYLFVKSPLESAVEFSELAKKYELLIVPSDSFGINGYVRLAYCVSTDMIERSLPAFQALKEEADKIINNRKR